MPFYAPQDRIQRGGHSARLDAAGDLEVDGRALATREEQGDVVRVAVIDEETGRLKLTVSDGRLVNVDEDKLTVILDT